MSDDADGFRYQPATSSVVGGRRVPMLVAVPIVAVCAALGTLAGVLHPPGPNGPAAHHPSETANAPSSSPELVGGLRPAPNSAAVVAAPSLQEAAKVARPADVPATADPLQQREQRERAAPAYKTASQQDTPAPVPAHLVKTGSVSETPQDETSTRLADQPSARAKRMRRAHMRRMRPAPPGSGPEKFFSSLFPIMPK